MFVSVDLPMPGEPPSRTSEPGTIPPPSTRSNSPIPVRSRGTGEVSTSASGRGRAGAAPREPPRGRRGRPPPARSSTIVFHASQPGHWPCQRGVGCPHAEQTWMVVGRAMSAADATDGPRRHDPAWQTRRRSTTEA